MLVKELKKGDYFKRIKGTSVLVRGKYVRELKKFSCHYFDDVNRDIFLRGDVEGHIDIDFNTYF